MTVKPLRNNIIAEVKETEEKVGSIILPDSAKMGPQQATVVATGDGYISEQGVLVPMEIQVGDTILFHRGAGIELAIELDTLLLLSEPEIIGIVKA